MKHFQFLILLLLFCVGCQYGTASKSHLIVIAVDQLGVNEVNCSKESEPDSGFDLLCEESVRMTHAFTPSILSGPALASLLTGDYPRSHGLRHHGKSWLSSSTTTLAEIARAQGYRTAFFSGGPPILRKLNLHQGFDYYDDYAPLPQLKAYRSFETLLNEFWSWQESWSSSPIFTLFYVSDLNFWKEQTWDRLGEKRNLSFESQRQEVDENLADFVQKLKQKKIWDQSLVLLVGLQGPPGVERDRELSWQNLLSERSQVTALIKAPQKPRDLGLSWSFDDNITIADLGHTLFEFMGTSLPSKKPFPTVSLRPILDVQNTFSIPDRPILIESAWAESKNEGTLRTSFRVSHLAYLNDLRPRVYNSLSDRLEVSPYSPDEPSIREFAQEMMSLAQNEHLTPWHSFSQEQILRWWGLAEVWNATGSQPPAFTLERLAHRLPGDPVVSDQFVYMLLMSQDWPELKSWAQSKKNTDLEKLATLNLSSQKVRFQNSCLQLANSDKISSELLKTCEDPLILDLLNWQLVEAQANDQKKSESLKHRFLYRYSLKTMDRWTAQTYWSLQGPWHLSSSLLGQLQTIDLVLALPQYSKVRTLAQKNYLLKPVRFEED